MTLRLRQLFFLLLVLILGGLLLSYTVSNSREETVGVFPSSLPSPSSRSPLPSASSPPALSEIEQDLNAISIEDEDFSDLE